jgi:hypothetical protein
MGAPSALGRVMPRLIQVFLLSVFLLMGWLSTACGGEEDAANKTKAGKLGKGKKAKAGKLGKGKRGGKASAAASCRDMATIKARRKGEATAGGGGVSSIQ